MPLSAIQNLLKTRALCYRLNLPLPSTALTADSVGWIVPNASSIDFFQIKGRQTSRVSVINHFTSLLGVMDSRTLTKPASTVICLIVRTHAPNTLNSHGNYGASTHVNHQQRVMLMKVIIKWSGHLSSRN